MTAREEKLEKENDVATKRSVFSDFFLKEETPQRLLNNVFDDFDKWFARN